MPENEDGSLKNLKLEAYLQGLVSCEFDSKTRQEVAALLDVTPQTLCNWDKKVDWDWVKDERRKRYAKKLSQVDDAMFKAANKGDVNAAKVLYERFDGWVPTNRTLNKEEASDDELRKRADEIRSQLLAISHEPQQGIDGNQPQAGEARA